MKIENILQLYFKVAYNQLKFHLHRKVEDLFNS